MEQTASDCYQSKDTEWLQEGTRENAEDRDGLFHGPLVCQVQGDRHLTDKPTH